jgi:geranylgeranyl transferase type-2 subunit beta
MHTGAFGTFPGHDAHILSTLSAIQILLMQDALDRLNKDRVTKCMDISSPTIVFP